MLDTNTVGSREKDCVMGTRKNSGLITAELRSDTYLRFVYYYLLKLRLPKDSLEKNRVNDTSRRFF